MLRINYVLFYSVTSFGNITLGYTLEVIYNRANHHVLMCKSSYIYIYIDAIISMEPMLYANGFPK